MTVHVRPTAGSERASVLVLVQHAFDGMEHSGDGSEEAQIVEDTWRLGDAVRPVDLVAVEDDGLIVGHVMAAQADAGGTPVLALAPLAVAPAQQRTGVGSALMAEALRVADEAGWPAVVLLGHPDYYPRFGFEPAHRHGLVYEPVGAESPAFQVRRLTAWDPAIRGGVRYCWEQQSRAAGSDLSTGGDRPRSG